MVIAKEDTKTKYHEQINRALHYIQENIDTKLTLDMIAKEAFLSVYHFHRIFTAFVGESIGEYISRIRLEKAAFRLNSSCDEITLIALDAGYETPAAFTRAFKKHFRMSPLEFRGKNSFANPGKSSSNIIKIREVIKMKPEFRTIKDIDVIYVRKTGAYQKAATSAWESICKFAYSRKLISKESQMLSISYDDPKITEADKLRYEACISIDKPVKPEGEVGTQTIKGGIYAVFLHKGPYENLHETYTGIFSGWLPESGEKLRDLPCIEHYLNRDPHKTKPENLRTEILVPVER